MKFDFESIIDRRGLDAIAIDGIGKDIKPAPQEPKPGFDVIPMWIADMNFKTAPGVVDSIKKRVDHPIYGYFAPRKEYFDAIIKWHEKYKKVEGLEAKHIGYENGVLGGLISAMNVFCSRGDKVLVHSPTYVGFTRALENNGYEIIHSPLVLDENNIYRMDFEDMEKKLESHKIHAAIFCSPHNPTGRVWEREEIERAMEIYKKHDVYVVSDEIWSDIIIGPNEHITSQSVSEDSKQRTVALYAPSKTFNLAGLVGSYHVIYNDYIRQRIEKESSLSNYNQINLLSMYALIGAYNESGREWVEEMKKTIKNNVDYACKFIDDNFKGVTYSKPQGTYMLFVDCDKYCREKHKSMDEIIKAGWDVGIAWQDGRSFHGKSHIRINLALPLAMVKEAFKRMKTYVFTE